MCFAVFAALSLQLWIACLSHWAASVFSASIHHVRNFSCSVAATDSIWPLNCSTAVIMNEGRPQTWHQTDKAETNIQDAVWRLASPELMKLSSECLHLISTTSCSCLGAPVPMKSLELTKWYDLDRKAKRKTDYVNDFNSFPTGKDVTSQWCSEFITEVNSPEINWNNLFCTQQ